MRSTSSTRWATKSASALLTPVRFFFAFMLRHGLQNPTRVPVAQARVVDQCELLPSRSVTAQIGGAFDRQPGARGERQADNLGVRMAARRPLLALSELGECFLPERSVMAAEEKRRQQRQAADLNGVQPAKHGA